MFRSGHDLDARGDAGLEALLDRQDVVEDAVDAEPRDHVLLKRLDVDVARPLADGLGQERVHEPDDRRVVGDLEQVRGLVELGGEERKVVLFHLLHRVLGLVHVLAVETVDGIEDHFGRGEAERDVGAEQHPEVVDGREEERFGGGGDDRAVLPPERQDDGFLGIGDRQLERQFPVDLAEVGHGRAGRAACRAP